MDWNAFGTRAVLAAARGFAPSLTGSLEAAHDPPAGTLK